MFGNKPALLNIPLENILPAEYNPRKYYNSLRLDELSRSIKMYGVLQPILVRKIGKKYQVISGERRIRASEIAGLKKIPAYVTNISDKDALIYGILENIQRENLTYIDECDSYLKLSENFKLNIPSIANTLCCDEKTIENKMRFKNMSSKIRKTISYYKISEEHAKILLRLPDDETRKRVITKITEENYDINQTKELVEKILLGELPAIKLKKKYNKTDLRLFKNTLNQTVSIMKKSGIRLSAKELDNENFYEYTIRVEKAK